jgi:GTPase SAR1 family protein
MTEQPLNILMVGLPGAGKTTFLAALWHVLRSFSGVLSLRELPSEAEYINSICEKWINCEPLERTLLGSHNLVNMKLEDRSSHKTVEVIFPDLSGETFREQLIHRQWKKDYEELILQSTGLFLFIHPNGIIDSPLIGEAEELLQELGEEETTDTIENTTEETTPSWNFEELSTQVRIVELLQLHIDCMQPSHAPRVAIIVSAWDLVSDQYDSPEAFVKKRLPLLDQYLASNSDIVLSTFFGVSAQGGDLPSKKKNLLKNIKPADRIIVKDRGNNASELTAPIRWLMMA